MHLILVSDIHLSSDPKASFGVDTRKNFTRVVKLIKEHRPDQVVMMGDYSLHEPLAEDVDWACKRLELAKVPYCFIAGNHDDPAHLVEQCPATLPLSNGELFFELPFGKTQALFLDTSSGSMSQKQADWVRRKITRAKQRVLVFMHHPPLHMGVPYMDVNYAFHDTGHEVYLALFSGMTPVHVFCGHYHTARSTQVGPHSVHLCPSTYFQLNADKAGFEVSHTMPGIRHIQLLEDQVRTWVEFLRPEPA
jgi:Icc protein